MATAIAQTTTVEKTSTTVGDRYMDYLDLEAELWDYILGNRTGSEGRLHSRVNRLRECSYDIASTRIYKDIADVGEFCLALLVILRPSLIGHPKVNR